MAELLTHPPAKDLADFGLGLLDESASLHIAGHLEECDDCQRTVAEAAGDTFTELLVGAKTVLDTPTPGEIIPPELAAHPRYTPLKLLGVGGMGTVWLAEHTVMGRRVAVKIIRPEFLARPGAGQRFRREVAAAARLHHPNIVTAFDAEQAGDVHFLAMEYIEGVGLDELLKEKGALPVADACRYALDAANGLEHAHRAGLVHRDVKPGNLMRATDGSVKVLDFGLAMLVADDRADMSLTGANMVVGTPDYIAPEQAEHPQAADGRADIYALGCTLYHLLTGAVPFPGASVLKKLDAHRQDRPKPLSSFRQDIPRGLAEVVTKMMSKDPADRFPSAAAVATALRPYIDSATTPPRTRSRVPMLVAAGLFLTMLLAGAVIYRIQTDKGELVISTQSEDVEVAIRQGGKLVTILDTKTQKKVELQSGEYDLELRNPDGLKLDITRATLMRGEKVLASIVRLPRNMPKEGAPKREWESPTGVGIHVPSDNAEPRVYTDSGPRSPVPSANIPPAIREEIPPPNFPVLSSDPPPMSGTGSLPGPVPGAVPPGVPPNFVPSPGAGPGSVGVPTPAPNVPGIGSPSPINPGPIGMAPPSVIPLPGGQPVSGTPRPAPFNPELHSLPPIKPNPGPVGVAPPGGFEPIPPPPDLNPKGVVPLPGDPLVDPRIPPLNPPLKLAPKSDIPLPSPPAIPSPDPGSEIAPVAAPKKNMGADGPIPSIGMMGMGGPAGPKREKAIHWPPKALPGGSGFINRLHIGIAEFDSLKFSPDERLVGVGNGQSITILETATGKELAQLKRNDMIWAFTPDSKAIVMAYKPGPNTYGFQHWSLETGEVSDLGTPIRMTERINSITTQSGPAKLVLSTNKSVFVFDTKANSIIKRVNLLTISESGKSARMPSRMLVSGDGKRLYSIMNEQMRADGWGAQPSDQPIHLQIDFLAEERETVRFKTPGKFLQFFEIVPKPEEPLIGILFDAENADAFVDYYDMKGKSRGHVPCMFKVAELRISASNANRAAIVSAKDSSAFEAIDLVNGFKRTPITRIANQDGLALSSGGKIFAARTETGWNLYRLPDPQLNKIADVVSLKQTLDEILKSVNQPNNTPAKKITFTISPSGEVEIEAWSGTIEQFPARLKQMGLLVGTKSFQASSPSQTERFNAIINENEENHRQASLAKKAPHLSARVFAGKVQIDSLKISLDDLSTVLSLMGDSLDLGSLGAGPHEARKERAISIIRLWQARSDLPKAEQGPPPRVKSDIHQVILTGTGLITVDGRHIKLEQLKTLPVACEVNLLAEKESSAELLRNVINELVAIKAKVNIAESRDPEKGITR